MLSNPTPPDSSRNIRTERHKRMQKIFLFLGLPISGTGFAFSIRLIFSGQLLLGVGLIFVSIGVAFLSIFWKFTTELGETVLDEIEKRLDDRAKLIAVWVVDGLENLIVGIWWRLTSKFQLDYYKQLGFQTRHYETQGLKTTGEYNLDLEKLFVPLAIAPESPNQIKAEIVPRRRHKKEGKDIWDFLVSIYLGDTRTKSLAILGAPGSGKTTLLRFITYAYAKRQHRKHDRKAPALVPFLIYLRDLFRQDAPKIDFKSLDLFGLLLQQERIAKLNPARQEQQWIRQQLQTGKALVMFDGLDEVPEESRQIVGKWIDKQIENYVNVVFLISSRPYGYKNNPLENVEMVLEAQAFTVMQRRQFINNWYLQQGIKANSFKEDEGVREDAAKNAKDLITRIEANPNILMMARNPLLLTMIATVHCFRGALPGRRVELYDEICDVLLGRRQSAKGIEDELTVDQKKPILQVLALELMLAKTLEFKAQQAEVWIQERLNNVAKSPMTTLKFIKLIEEQVGLIVEQEQGIYAFAHKTFQEYLAAVQIEKTQRIDLLTQNMGQEWWAETIRLFAALSEDATPLISETLIHPNLNSMQLAWDCLAEGVNIKMQIREAFNQKIERDLLSSDYRVFTFAAQILITRRVLQNFIPLDDDHAQDQTCITNAEYEFFCVNKKSPEAQKLLEIRFKMGQPEEIKSGIARQDMIDFCDWLGRNTNQEPTLKKEGFYHIYYPLGISADIKHSPESLELMKSGKIQLVRYQVVEKYSLLAFYLATGQWQKADQETWQMMLKVAKRESDGYLDEDSIKQFPCQDLKIIDHLWVKYSNGKFGFSVQKKIWLDCGGVVGQYKWKPIEKVWDRVDWSNPCYDFDLDKAKYGHYGHLPNQLVFQQNITYHYIMNSLFSRPDL